MSALLNLLFFSVTVRFPTLSFLSIAAQTCDFWLPLSVILHSAINFWSSWQRPFHRTVRCSTTLAFSDNHTLPTGPPRPFAFQSSCLFLHPKKCQLVLHFIGLLLLRPNHPTPLWFVLECWSARELAAADINLWPLYPPP